MRDERIYGIEELAERAGVSRRTVRYYIQRGLLPRPDGLGRGKHYGEEHLQTLVRVRELQETGVSLVDISARLGGGAEVPAPVDAEVAQSTWSRVVLADGVELHVRGRRLSQERLRALIDAVTEVIGEDER